MGDSLLNVMNDSKAWYFVIVEPLLNKRFTLLVIPSTPFSPAISTSSISRTASKASSSRERTKADPCRFAGSLVKYHHIWISCSKFSCFTIRKRWWCFGAIWGHFIITGVYNALFCFFSSIKWGLWIFFLLLPLIKQLYMLV